MKIVFLLDQVYLPSLGGGNKAARLLLEGLAGSGHECAAIARATTTRAGPSTEDALVEQMGERGIELQATGEHAYRFRYRGVEVDALNLPPDASRSRIVDRLGELDPDWVLVSDDRHRVLAEAALTAAPERLVYLVQTVVHLPFGPLSASPDDAQTERMRRACARVVISESLGEYLQTHAALDATRLLPPVFGEGPFPDLSSFERGYVTLVNPCAEKGLDLFLGLAEAFPDVAFAAVPTWGAGERELHALSVRDNVTLLAPTDAISGILRETRVLLAPSLWPETLGYVVIEAMLHGVPVLASDIGGLREAKLGVDYLLPVRPAERIGGAFVSPEQDLAPWRGALREVLTRRDVYERCSRESRAAAAQFVAPFTVSAFEAFLAGTRPIPTAT